MKTWSYEANDDNMASYASSSNIVPNIKIETRMLLPRMCQNPKTLECVIIMLNLLE